jgi:hypothetical protein
LLLQILTHLTKWYFLLVPHPCQKNVLLILSILSEIVFGARYTVIW